MRSAGFVFRPSTIPLPLNPARELIPPLLMPVEPAPPPDCGTATSAVGETASSGFDERARLLLDVSRDVSSQGGLKDRLDRVHRHIAEALGADFVGTVREDPERLESRIIHHFGVPPDIAPDVDRVRVPRGVVFGGRISGGETVVLSASETRALLPLDLGSRLALSTLVIVPLVVRGQFYGALLAGTGGVNTLPREGAEILEAIAAQIASAIEAADVEEQRKEEDSISRATARISTQILEVLDSPSLLDRLCKVACTELHGDMSCVFLASDDGQSFELSNASGTGYLDFDTLRSIVIPRSAVGSLVNLLEKEDVVFAPASRLEELVPEQLRVAYAARESIFVAIRRGPQLIGVQSISWRSYALQFGRRERRIGESLSTMGSLALERARAIAATEAASRLKSDFVATMSHELRTPLNVILGYSEMLLDEALGGLTEEQSSALRRLDLSARGLSQLVNSTLDLSRLEAGRARSRVSEVNLRDFVSDVVNQAREAYGKPGVDVVICVDADLTPVLVDLEKVQVVLGNLVNNAFKFTNQGHVEVSARISRGAIELAVSDTGVGIDDCDRDAVFDSFRRGTEAERSEASGVGLGLYIVRQVVNFLGGEIALETTKGEGSRFGVSLPLDSGPADSEREVA